MLEIQNVNRSDFPKTSPLKITNRNDPSTKKTSSFDIDNRDAVNDAVHRTQYRANYPVNESHNGVDDEFFKSLESRFNFKTNL